ncbi:MAG: cyclic nucleotide-binding domain-containing protein [Actinomycetota bacterium]
MPRRSQAKLLELLKTVPLLHGLSKRELKTVLQAAEDVEHPAGEAIVREGATGAGFHLIVEGEASVSIGGKVLGKRLRPGDYFGEMALIDKGPRSATVSTVTPVRTLVISAWTFNPLLEQFPSIARKLLIEMTKRLRAAEDSLTH